MMHDHVEKANRLDDSPGTEWRQTSAKKDAALRVV
jgi:hypothetical protein